MTEFVSEQTDYDAVEREPPEVAARNLITGTHLWASATAFFFVGFLFAYFYLRSIDSGGKWRPHHVGPSLALGTASTACLVAAAVAVHFALQHQRAGRRPQWRRLGVLALVLCLATLALQAAEWATQGFGPTDGAYASVYLGWTGMLFLFVIGTAYWLETVVATAIRYRKVAVGGEPPPGHASGDPHRMSHDIADPLSLLRPQLAAINFYVQFLAGIAVLTWVILYLV